MAPYATYIKFRIDNVDVTVSHIEASFPLIVPVSELMAGENVIELRLTGSRGSTFTSVFRIILGMTKLY